MYSMHCILIHTRKGIDKVHVRKNRMDSFTTGELVELTLVIQRRDSNCSNIFVNCFLILDVFYKRLNRFQ